MIKKHMEKINNNIEMPKTLDITRLHIGGGLHF